MKRLFLLAAFILNFIPMKADEGMWLMMLIKRLNGVDMQKQGLKLTPEEIYASYVDAGIITETLTQDGSKSKSVNMEAIYARFEDYKERLLPQLPGMAKKASKTLLSIGSALSYIVGVLTFIITPAILYLLGSSWQPFENVTAFPVLSTVTLVLLGGVGLFGGLVCIFVGIELRGVRERYFQNID